MKWDKAHQGQHRQDISQEEAENTPEGVRPGITPDLHAPEIANPADEPETNLHGDVEGSPYSTSPGEMSLADAHAQEKASADQPRTDDRSTRAREAESRNTGVPTETLAAEDDAEDSAPKPKRPGSSKK